MIALAFLWAWSGYGTMSWGWCLVKGYDIPFGAWFNPLRPYEWPADGSPPLVPKGQVWPGGGGGGDSAGGGGSGGGSGDGGGSGGGGKKWNIWTGYL